MKRSARLASLSRDHHQALVVAQQLRRATDATAAEARTAFLTYWSRHGRLHFRLEEEVPLPCLRRPRRPARSGRSASARRARDDPPPRGRAGRRNVCDPGALALLGDELAAHVRLEEREVFPLIERVMPEHELDAVAHALEPAHAAR